MRVCLCVCTCVGVEDEDQFYIKWPGKKSHMELERCDIKLKGNKKTSYAGF